MNYRFTVKYAVADIFGDIQYAARCDMNQNTPIPAAGWNAERILWEAQVAQCIRHNGDTDWDVPPGRIVILAITETERMS